MIPPMMLAHSFSDDLDPTGWWMSEKLDGIRAWYDGESLTSRLGNRFAVPKGWLKGLPKGLVLEGELWAGRGNFDVVTSTVRKKEAIDAEWQRITFLLFDAPFVEAPYEERMALIDGLKLPPHVRRVAHARCQSAFDLAAGLKSILSLGGEGLMLRKPGSLYTHGRSHDLLKVKPFHDAEAIVKAYQPGEGKHLGRVGALLVEANGKRFKLGTGLSDEQREHPPAFGSTVTYRYTELTPAGIPRFPRFLRVREDV